MTQVNKERMLAEFKEIVALPCHSLQERPVFELLKGKLEALGFTVEEDDAGEKLGGNCGNMWAFLPASAGVEGAVRVLLSAHMDGVEPCGGTTVIQKDGVLYSDGTTILGGDDKSGVEGILEGIRLLLEEGAPHGDIQILFTVCEEGGVNGSRCLDRSKLRSDVGYALDGEGAPGEIVVGAPGQKKYKIDIIGRTAHGGLEPEKGINSIMIAAKALADVKRYGRIDEETTCNIGLISGGMATNIVPDTVEIKGECRSRNQGKMEKLTKEIVDAYRAGAEEAGAKIDIEVLPSYNPYVLSHDSTAMIVAKKAAENIGLVPDITGTGGGSDANHFNEYGISCTVLGVGMTNCHTCEECLIEEDLYKTAEWVLEMVKVTAEQ